MTAHDDTHDDTHDPFLDHAECFICADILRRTLNTLAGLNLGPHDVDALMAKMREIAAEVSA